MKRIISTIAAAALLAGGGLVASAPVSAQSNCVRSYGQQFCDGAPYYRIAGADRYHTSVVTSQRFYRDGAPIVYLASGEGPDALSASFATTPESGPMLLIRPGAEQLDTATADEIRRLDPLHLIVYGGDAAVHEAVVQEAAAIVAEGRTP